MLKQASQWTEFTVLLQPHHLAWFKFEHGGNVDLGNQTMEASLMAGPELELGLAGEYYFTPGTASLDLCQIKVEEFREI